MEKDNNIKAYHGMGIVQYPEKSFVVCYVGSRGSGKTLSMTYWAALELIKHKRVWSNYPISFSFRWPDGFVEDFASEPLNMDALYVFDNELANGTVFIDEVTLWSDSRRSMGVVNRLLNSIFTLIRKRKLSFYLTTQSFEWLDRRMQFQTDALVSCFDMHYINAHYEKGAHISQTSKDLSGYFTGFQYKDTQKEYKQIFHGKFLWGAYDTNQEFDVLGAMASVKLKLGTKVIEYTSDDSTTPPVDEQGGANHKKGDQILPDFGL